MDALINTFFHVAHASATDVLEVAMKAASGTHIIRKVDDDRWFHHGIVIRDNNKVYVVDFTTMTSLGVSWRLEELHDILPSITNNFEKLKQCYESKGYGDFGSYGDRLVARDEFKCFQEDGQIRLITLSNFLRLPNRGTAAVWVLNGLEEAPEKQKAAIRALEMYKEGRFYSYHTLFRNCEHFINACFGQKYAITGSIEEPPPGPKPTYEDMISRNLCEVFSSFSK